MLTFFFLHVTVDTMQSSQSRKNSVALAVAAMLVSLSLAGSARGSSFNWMTGVSFGGYDALVGSGGFAERNFIKIWRPIGYSTQAAYYYLDGNPVVSAPNSGANPFTWSVYASYAEPYCVNHTDPIVKPYTCQSTRP